MLIIINTLDITYESQALQFHIVTSKARNQNSKDIFTLNFTSKPEGISIQCNSRTTKVLILSTYFPPYLKVYPEQSFCGECIHRMIVTDKR